ncbi:hypothetical protein JCM21142_93728 [Saccharicrinis fermentans DSM 9555 = JCM 21142]|uniref:Uncharacterized protein n=1 Tax=Saccharicrinis fermentans DSM 9555 = JCM 21142 TaxID=869213 RepID=W7Y2D3_9BACT|nr:hypothetical protein JCM21142_93728 [Saccharicrinis fermentans DSM 9555 = JCM 21142]
METKRVSKYAKWLVSGTSYLFIKNYLDKQESSIVEGNRKKLSKKSDRKAC